MLFSVLIPVYNTEKYLESCIRSIIDTGYDNYEMILVDDGSTDRSPQICDAFMQQYPDIVKVVHKENEGLISARRIGIANAGGAYCIFVDSDDSIESQLFSELEGALAKEPDTDIILYSFFYCGEGEAPKRKKAVFADGTVFQGEDKSLLYQKLVTCSDIISIWSKCIKTSILKSDPTDYTEYYGNNMGEDHLQSLYPITVSEKIVYISTPLYNYRINTNSISRRCDTKTISTKNTKHVFKKVEQYFPEWHFDYDDMYRLLAASEIGYAIYTMRLYYESASGKKEKNTVLGFDWTSFVNEKSMDRFSGNPYLTEHQKKIWTAIIAKNRVAVKRILNRSVWYIKLRNAKRRLLGKKSSE